MYSRNYSNYHQQQGCSYCGYQGAASLSNIGSKVKLNSGDTQESNMGENLRQVLEYLYQMAQKCAALVLMLKV